MSSSSDLHVNWARRAAGEIVSDGIKNVAKGAPLRADAERDADGTQAARGSPSWDPRTQDIIGAGW